MPAAYAKQNLAIYSIFHLENSRATLLGNCWEVALVALKISEATGALICRLQTRPVVGKVDKER